ncbi:MAG: HPP family protein [Methanobacteriota archaeon]
MSKIILIDKKFRKNTKKYIFQCVLATLTVFAILLFLDVLSETAIITSLGASAFIVFTMPNRYMSDPRRLIGGYIVGLTIGILFHLLLTLIIGNTVLVEHINTLVIFGAIAVGFSIFIMAVTNTEHAPAAGISLGLVINQWDYLTLLFIIGAILWMSIIRKLLKPYLMDLISPHLRGF